MNNEFLKFEHVPFNGKTQVLLVRGQKEAPLGYIKYYPPWRKYVFMPFDATVFDGVCLNSVIDKLQELNSKD